MVSNLTHSSSNKRGAEELDANLYAKSNKKSKKEIAADSDSEQLKEPWEEPIQDLSIKMLDFKRLDKDYRATKKLKKEDLPPSLENLAEFIIEKYNENNKKTFEKIEIPKEAWKKIETKGFSILAFHSVALFSNPISIMLKKMDVEAKEKSGEVSYLFFLYRVHKEAHEIFALAAGNRGYRPVQQFSDFTFPRKIALRLLNSKEQSRETSRRIIGRVLASTELLQSRVLFDPNSLEKIFTEFQASLRNDASIHHFKYFQLKGGKVPKKPIEVEIREGLVRFHKRLPFAAYPFILDHLASISRGDETYIYQPNLSEKIIEQDAKEDFAFLDYFTPVSGQRHKALEKRLLKELASALIHQDSLDWTFAHPHINDYFKAHEFRIRYIKEKGGVIVTSWDSYRKNFLEIMDTLRKIPHLKLKEADLERELKKIYFDFKNGDNWDLAPITDCLIGQVSLEIEGNHYSYFKLNNKWYEISSNLLSRVNDEFRKVLIECRIKSSEESFLSHPWQTASQEITLKEIAKTFQLKKDENLNELLSLKVAFVSKEGKMLHSQLEGEILSHPVIHHYRNAIEIFLTREKPTIEVLEKKLGKSFAQIALDELMKERSIAEKKTVVDKNNKKKEIVIIKNPFPPKDHFLFKHRKILRNWALKEEYTMHEGPYNETYLYTTKNKNIPYQLNKNGWIVGDRIEYDGIELFDIAYFNKDSIFLYHVKKSFDKARDALSQVMNSARMLSKQGNIREKALAGFYDEVIKKPKKTDKNFEYFSAARNQFLSWGKEGKKNFIELFDKRKIVFVYALADDRKNEHIITDKGLGRDQFTELDFASEKTKDVAVQLFAELKAQQFLDVDGKKGPRFNELYHMEALKFNDEKLRAYSKFAYHILTGDISFFGSLIGRMDLLHTRAQVEGLGFGFKICQIQSPGNIGVEEITVKPLIWENLDEEFFYPLKHKIDNPILFYRTPWFEEAECWMKKNTKGEGSCAFHALLGQEVEGEMQCNADKERVSLAKALEDGLNGDKNGFNDKTLDELYKANLISCIEEAEKKDLKPGNPSYQLRRCSKALFRKNETGDYLEDFKNYLKQDLRAKQTEVFKQIKNHKGLKPKSDLIKILKDNNETEGTLDNFFSHLNDEEILYDAMSQSISSLESLSQNSKTYDWLNHNLDEYKKIKKMRESAKKDLRKSPEVMCNFLECIKNTDYWLSDDELQMLAHVNNLRVEIMREDIDGDFGCNNKHQLETLENDMRERIVIHADGSHYSQCIPFEKINA